MKCREICNRLEAEFPKDKAYSWDNVGLLVGSKDVDVKKIFVTVDATDNTIEKANQQGADLIVCHHPLIFSPLKTVTSENFISNRVIKLIQSDINLFAMHTNYDVLNMADVVAEKLELHDYRPLEITSDDENIGIGKIGKLPMEMTLNEIAEFVKDRFILPGVNVFKADSLDLDTKISEIAVLPGSGKSAIETVIRNGIKVYITGDIGHHDGLDSASRGLSIIDAGHYGLEHVFIEDMVQVLRKLLPGIEVLGDDITHPYYCI